jgi:peptide-methionine (S)-S-oxide reductase
MAEREIITLGGGCFWCLEAVYRETEGVESAVSGYMGGASANPTYKQVCSGTTGHVEVVQLTFDPDTISCRDVLEIFFVIHDPTTLNSQGNDHGTQYRSVIFFHSPEQEELAKTMIAELNARNAYGRPVVTAVEPASTFYVAEGYHQDYFANNRYQPYCAFVVAPKVQKFREKFAARRKPAGR